MRSGRLSAVLFSLLMPLPTAFAEDAKVLLETVRNRHRETLEKMKSVTYFFKLGKSRSDGLIYENTHKVEEPQEASDLLMGRFWHTPDQQRMNRIFPDGSVRDDLIDLGRYLICETPSRSRPMESKRISAGYWKDSLHIGEYAGLMLLHPAREEGQHEFHKLFLQPHRLIAVERIAAAADGQVELIRVELSHDSNHFEFWFSPKHNYLMTKRVDHPMIEPNHRYEQEVLEFAEPNPGQFFPSKIEWRRYDRSGLKRQGSKELTQIRLNQPIPAEEFRIPGIDGELCHDGYREVRYRIDADGFRVGPATPLNPPQLLPKNPNPVPPAPIEDANEGMNKFLIWSSIGILALLLCAAVLEIRRLRGMLAKAGNSP